MADTQKGTFRFNSKPFVAFRIAAYLTIIVCLFLWGRQNRRNAASRKPAQDQPAPSSSQQQSPNIVDLASLYPSVTLYGWAVRPASEGQQQVDVLLGFGQPSAQIELKELDIKLSALKLRAKGSLENLTHAVSKEGAETVQEGVGHLTFLVPAGKAEFRAGTVFYSTKDLCILNRNQRVLPKDFDKWMEDIKAGKMPDAAPEKAPPVKAPPASVPQLVGAQSVVCR